MGKPNHISRGATDGIEKGQAGCHGGNIELGATVIGMRQNAAIGDDEGRAVGQEPHLMRANAGARKFPNALEVVRRVVDTEHASTGIKVVFGRKEQAAISREGSVPAERTPRRGVDPSDDGTGHSIEDADKRARADFVISTAFGFDFTRAHVQAIIELLNGLDLKDD